MSSVDFHTLTLQLPIQTQNNVVPELQVFQFTSNFSKTSTPQVKSVIFYKFYFVEFIEFDENYGKTQMSTVNVSHRKAFSDLQSCLIDSVEDPRGEGKGAMAPLPAL